MLGLSDELGDLGDRIIRNKWVHQAKLLINEQALMRF